MMQNWWVGYSVIAFILPKHNSAKIIKDIKVFFIGRDGGLFCFLLFCINKIAK